MGLIIPTRPGAALDFLSGTGLDQNGRTIADYIRFEPEDWEGCHDVIQWAFPTRTVSHYNGHAPILPETFNPTTEQCMNVEHLFRLYLDAMGIAVGPGWTHYQMLSFKVRSIAQSEWIRIGDHNYKRFSRIIECLKAFGLEKHAEDFHDFLVFDFAVQYSDNVDAKTVAFWTATWQDKHHLLRD